MPQPYSESRRSVEKETGAPLATDVLARRVADRLAATGVHSALMVLNGTVPYRFTGVYRFDGDWVVSVALYDRKNPTLTLGANVKMQESYCRIAGEVNAAFEIADAPHDPRLDGHAARNAVQSYVVVLLRDAAGKPWGTLCHFDFIPHRLDPSVLTALEAVRPAVEKHMATSGASRWVQPAEPGPGSPRLHPPT